MSLNNTVPLQQVHLLAQHLANAGLTSELVRNVQTSPHNVLAQRIVHLLQADGYVPHTTLADAYAIFGGKYMCLPRDTYACFGIDTTVHEVTSLGEVPFAPELLTALRDTHALIPIPPISLNELTDARFVQEVWYAEELFARETVPAHWCLLQLEPVANSGEKPWVVQKTLVSPHYVIPSVRTFVFATLALDHIFHLHPFASVQVRCADPGYTQGAVAVGMSKEEGVCILPYRSDYMHPAIQVAVARRY
jgi:hypothetical protein